MIYFIQHILELPKTRFCEISGISEYGAGHCFYTFVIISKCILFAPESETWAGRAVSPMNVHLAHASAVETRWFAIYDVWIVHVSTLGAARHACQNDDKNINNKLFGAELLRVALSALVSGNQVHK